MHTYVIYISTLEKFIKLSVIHGLVSLHQTVVASCILTIVTAQLFICPKIEVENILRYCTIGSYAQSLKVGA